MRSDPKDRLIKTKRARATLASQAPSVKIIKQIWRSKKDEEAEDIVIRRANLKIVASKDRRAIKRCFR